MIHVLVVLGFYSDVCGARRILYLPTETLSHFSNLYFQRSFNFILTILLAHVEIKVSLPTKLSSKLEEMYFWFIICLLVHRCAIKISWLLAV